MNSINKLAASAIVLMSLGGCAGKSIFEPVLETDGKQMIDIYRNALEDGETVDEKLERRAAEEAAAAGAQSPSGDENSLAVTGDGPTAAQLAEASKKRQYRLKSYTKWNGRYFDKETGAEVKEFQCGVGGKVQSTPCPAGYGDIPSYREVKQRKREERLATLENDVAKGPATAQSIIAEQERWMEEKRRRDAAVASGIATEHKQPTPPPAPKPQPATGFTQVAADCTAQDGIYCGYERTARNEIQQLFPRLPNPDILVFVTPHLATRNRVPVPGYTTVLPLYDQVHYAMPGEKPAHE